MNVTRESVHPRALVSVHDVTPRYAAQLAAIEAFLNGLEVSRTYLIIPLFHECERYDIRRNGAFTDSLKSSEAELCLHGYTHLGTRNEFEFAGLEYGVARSKIEAATKIFVDCFARRPSGFVPPAWKINAESLRAVRDAQFQYVATGWRIMNLRSMQSIRNAACTFCYGDRTRNSIYGALSDANFLYKRFRHDLIQVCIHPQDSVKTLHHEISMIKSLRKRDYVFETYQESLASWQ